jgi:uncharacterized membrane protein YoaK (UPF0700 family)
MTLNRTIKSGGNGQQMENTLQGALTAFSSKAAQKNSTSAQFGKPKPNLNVGSSLGSFSTQRFLQQIIWISVDGQMTLYASCVLAS